MRIVLADDSALVREGLVRLIAELGHEVVAAVGSATELLAAVREQGRPDVVVSDIRMPPRGADDGLVACLELRRELPGLPCVLLSQHMERAYAEELLADGRGGVGYLLKDRVTDIAAFGRAIESVAAGGTVLDPELAAALVSRHRDPLESLTPREREVLTLMTEGRSNAGIQETLVLSAGAVEKHVTSIFAKLGLVAAPDDHRRVLAVLTSLGARRPSA
ncbi:response regulator transcription factor [Demequina capsici]|uniref:Response regulator transcription factor n=1 Tax=Demequina capsici TaxID=3075620 RepID=A0AA96F944_9MICO|nr:response regulator transcription factor [Demequina sp. OYTSA14]WNM24311.1 response regulator transcription factor [Demequina sp. OYTSA14]